ncbi:K02A2.6-like [Cordylochernes scorpioides]|uniref:K02A2.6-like n=1 Tax=Cordylochernes scorpioides TaxID=51811 RepID=A0ABY6JZB0_9ARAC|nr:K02A2.6-like [Cordylochernes scorpioides]
MASGFCIPETLVSDNGPPFFSKEFQNFTRTWNIVHVTSSPYHAQSNGMVERTVQTLKKLIKRCGEESTDPYLALLNLRNTPHNNLPSPAQILMSRKLRSIIPSKTSQFVPSMINNEAIQKQLVDNQVKMKNYYDRHTRPEDPLSINDRVCWGKLKEERKTSNELVRRDQESYQKPIHRRWTVEARSPVGRVRIELMTQLGRAVQRESSNDRPVIYDRRRSYYRGWELRQLVVKLHVPRTLRHFSPKFTTERKHRWSSYTPGSTEPNNNLQVRHMSNGHTFLRAYVMVSESLNRLSVESAVF